MSNCSLIRDGDQITSLISLMANEPLIACDLEATGLDVKKAKLSGVGLGTSSKQYFISFPNEHKEYIGKVLSKIFKDKEVVFHNAKFDLELMYMNNLPWPEKIHDTMIMSWLVDEDNQHGLKPLSKALLGKDLKKWVQLDNEANLFRTDEDILKELSDYCGEDVASTYDLYFYFLPMLKKEGLTLDYEKIELKLIKVLARMELRGVKVDKDWLRGGMNKIKLTLSDLEVLMKERLSKPSVNIRSSKQLEDLLFNELGYLPTKVTDTGRRSTDNEALEAIIKDNDLKKNDFVSLLLRFRELDKLCTTYFEALLEQSGEDEMIHTNFMQHRTRTGRLASNAPNLQNIPTRADEWNVRKAFIPREGYKFLLADYSQIELRMLAHFSRDENMVNTFLEGGDIHAKTMELTGTNRKIAKGINFGLIYGMGSRTLAHTLDIKEENARKYISKFFAGYPKVNYFIKRVQQNTFDKGYVEMITGRRRRFREIRDRRWFSTIQRQSINSLIQGSAADLIKIAMIKLGDILPKYDSHMLIQIHDEIIVEAPLDKTETVKGIIKETMENALKLRVPIKVNIIEGDCWVKD